MSSQDTSNIKITILYDNNSYKAGLTSAWGFSCFITGLKKSILFDTGGDGNLLMKNMKKLDIHPKAVDVIFISHNHWDHTGGIFNILKKNSNVAVYVPASFPEHFVQDVENYGARIIKIAQSVELFNNVYSSGQLGTAIKEQSLIIDTAKGSILITGCAHPGIIQIAKTTKNILNSDILLALGGFHLSRERDKTVSEIVDRFKSLNIKYAAPCHCSGDKARAIFKQKYNEHYIEIGLGKVLNFNQFH